MALDPWTNANRSLPSNLYIYDEPKFIHSLEKRRERFQTMETEYDKEDIIRPEINGMKISSKLGPLICTIVVHLKPTVHNFLARKPEFYGTFNNRTMNQKGNFGETIFAFLCEKLQIPAMPTATNAPVDFRTQLYYTRTDNFDLNSIWHDAYEIKYTTKRDSQKALTHPYQLKHIMVTVYEEHESKCILKFHKHISSNMELLPQFAKLNYRIVKLGDGPRTLLENMRFFDSEYPPQKHTHSITIDTPTSKKRTVEKTVSESQKHNYAQDDQFHEFLRVKRRKGPKTRRHLYLESLSQ